MPKHHVMKVYSKRRSKASLILNFSTRWRWLVCFIHWSFYPGRESPLPFR